MVHATFPAHTQKLEESLAAPTIPEILIDLHIRTYIVHPTGSLSLCASTSLSPRTLTRVVSCVDDVLPTYVGLLRGYYDDKSIA